MAFIDEINAFKALMYVRFDNKTLAYSIKRFDSGNSFRELADLLTEAYTGIVSFNIAKFGFSTTDGSPNLIIDNYISAFKPFFGPIPVIVLFVKTPIYDTDGETIIGFTFDEEKQTPAKYKYTSDDFTGDIEEIRWEYPIATNGYFTISGAGSGLIGLPIIDEPLQFTQDDLEDAGGGDYYLPLPLPNGQIPIFTSSNGQEITTNYKGDQTPPRLYGNFSLEPQVIKVYIG